MTKYNHYPKKPEPQKTPPEQQKKRRQKLKISPACCIPVFMKDQPGYGRMLKSIREIKGFLPADKQTELGQIFYMDELLADMEDYTPPVEHTQPPDLKELIAQVDTGGKMTDTLGMLEAFSRFQQNQDMTQLLPYLIPGQPMLSMLLPMLQGGGASMGGDLMSLLPFLNGLQ